MNWRGIAEQIQAATGLCLTDATARQVSGGSINAAWSAETGHGRVFIKVNDAQRLSMFEAEAAGLAELAATGALRVPEPLCTGVCGSNAFIALEYLGLERPDAEAHRRLGYGLAALHDHHAEQYGWHRDNTIGTTAQINTRSRDWAAFFRVHRLDYQLRLASQRGATALVEAGQRLSGAMTVFFSGASCAPCLLHGDLWGGNWAALNGSPVIYDPAVYYGDPETDIAMTRLFGGFDPVFYSAYRERIPETEGAAQRRELYRLYHVLNHYNLFGGGYGSQAKQIIDRLLAET